MSTPLWTPAPARSASSRLGGFLGGHGFSDYEAAWQWSVGDETRGAFWSAIAEWGGVRWSRPPAAPVVPDAGRVPGVQWFPEARVNYAEHMLRGPSSAVAVVARSQSRPDGSLTWGELREMVGRIRRGLVTFGVGRGDVVAGYLPNIPEALALMLATASLGAVWTCCAPEMGVAGVLDRLTQVEPSVLVAVDGYRYGTKEIDRREEAATVRDGLASLRAAVMLPYLSPLGSPAGGPSWTPWEDFAAQGGPVEFEPLPFDHPLYVLYSSGTTGQPKAIVHGHGGILLEHLKALGLHFDLGEGDVFFWYTTTGWMMWNFCVSGLLTGATIVLFDGDPSDGRLWQIMDSTGATCGGVGAGYLVAGMKAGLHPGADHDLSALRTLGSTGSPLPPAAASWVYREVGGDVMLASFSGGTDVCTGFVGTSPLHPVWGGEISCRCLGARVEVYTDSGSPVVGEEGELVLTAPLPSMPVGIVGDTDDRRYRSTYFSRFPGVWAHGDRATLTERGTVIITGRSDGTLNRGGVRMGTAEFYSVVEGLPGVADSLIVHVEDPDRLLLFVVPAGEDPAADLAATIRTTIRQELSPRHVPDSIELVARIPRTLSGKKLEVPVKRILAGVPADQAVARASVDDPASLDWFVARAGAGL